MKKALYYVSMAFVLLPIPFMLFFYIFNPTLHLFAVRDSVAEKASIEFVTFVVNKDIVSIENAIDKSMFENDFMFKIKSFYATNDFGSIQNIELVETGERKSTKDGSKKDYFSSSFEVKVNNSYYLTTIVIDKLKKDQSIVGFNLKQIGKPVKEITSLRSIRINMKNSCLFIYGLAMLVVSFLAIRKIHNNTNDYKSISYIGVLVGFLALAIDLNLNKFSFQPISIHFPALSISKLGNLGDWNMVVSIPIYAIYVLVKNKSKPKEVENVPTNVEENIAE